MDYTKENLSISPRRFEFGEFSFDADSRILWRGAETVQLAPKACELLGVLIENAPQVISKENLMNQVWADAFVEEANLTHHISALRKALGEDKKGKKFIETIPRKGYRFVAPVNKRENGAAEIVVSERTTARLAVEEQIEMSDAPPLELPQSVPRKRINRNYYAALAAAGILLAVIFGLAYYKFPAAPNRAALADSPQPMTTTRVTDSGKVGASSISPDGKFVAYSLNYTESEAGEGAVFVRQVDTNIETKLATHVGGSFGTREFSSDGAFIFYVVSEKFNPAHALYRVPVLGGQTVRLLDRLGGANTFGLSPDSARAAFIRENAETKQGSLIVAALDGSQTEQILLTKNLEEIQLLGTPAWSPDGRLISFPARFAATTKNYTEYITNVMTFDTATGELRKMTEETWSDMFLLRWLPDGGGVVVIGTRPRTRNQIYLVAHPSGEVRCVTSDSNGYGNYGLGITKDGNTLVADVWEFNGRIWAMDASGDTRTAVRLPAGDTSGSGGLTDLPDSRVVFGAATNFNYDLWTMRGGDGAAVPLVSNPAYEGEPVAAPDGSFIVFTSDRDGTSHLFRSGADGSNVRQLTSGASFNKSPDISPDGNWIVYTSTAYNPAAQSWTNFIYKIPSAGGEPVQLTDYDAYVPAFAPDGELISCHLSYDGSNPKIVVIPASGGKPVKSFDFTIYNSYPIPARFTPDGNSLIYRQVQNQTINLWKQNLAGGAATQFTDFKSEYIFYFVFTRDGKRLLLSRGSLTVNVVMIKNFRGQQEK